MSQPNDDIRARPYLAYFPHAEFYDHQLEAMGRIYRSLQHGRVVLFEGACGTGKTLLSLAPALAVGREQGRKVVIATNVHQQMAQFQHEAALIKQRRDIRVVVLKGKELLCPLKCKHDECDLRRQGTQNLMRARKRLAGKRGALAVMEVATEGDVAVAAMKLRDEIEEDDGQQARLKQTCCEYLLENLEVGGGEAFRKWLHDGVRSPEEVSHWAEGRGLCGYELLKGELARADLVICNYQHLLDPSILNIFLGWLGCGMSDVIAIFDEAHNLESAAREHASTTLARTTLRRAIDEAADSPDVSAHATGLLDAVDAAMEICLNDLLEFGRREALNETWEDLPICELDGSRDLFFERVEIERTKRGWDLPSVIDEVVSAGVEMQVLYDRMFNEGREQHHRSSAMLSAGYFLRSYLDSREDPRYYPLMGVRRTRDGDINVRVEVFACVPTDVTRPLFSDLNSVVLMSATLQPFDALRQALGIERECEELSFGLTFPPRRRCTLTVDAPPLFSNRRSEPSVTDAVGRAITEIVESTPGAVVVFFPSYQELNRYRGLLRLDAELFIDRLGVPADDARRRFFACAERGERAVLFSYLWGTLAEGVDYRDSRARTVVVVGVGYPHLGFRNRAVQRAYDAVLGSGMGWDYAVSAPTIRRIRQALGRNVRSPQDYGARVLLDRRYCSACRSEMGRYSVHDLFPERERDEFDDCDVTSLGGHLKTFFNSLSAGDGAGNRPE